jgi:hypothetical protein
MAFILRSLHEFYTLRLFRQPYRRTSRPPLLGPDLDKHHRADIPGHVELGRASDQVNADWFIRSARRTPATLRIDGKPRTAQHRVD